MLATVALLAISLLPFQAEQPILFEGLGAHTRKVTTSNPLAQRYFDQGLNFLYAFNHDESIRAFQEAARLDPGCAMAWWGIAIANGPHINNPAMMPEQTQAAVAALEKAETAKASTTEKELIEAAGKRYSLPHHEDRGAHDKAFADAMREVWKKYPRDADIGALFAESMMDLRPWDLWTAEGKPQPGTKEITDTLAEVLSINHQHPLALHLTIHAWEASPTPEKANTAASILRNLQPGLGHMVHMPSHIDVRTGQWREAILANEKAIVADDKYRKLRPRIGFYSVYMMHNHHMLAYAAMMRGQSSKAIAAMDAMIAGIPESFKRDAAPVIDGYLAMPLEVRVRFGKWSEILAYPEFAETFPLARALRHATRGVAYAAMGNVPSAEAEQKLFLAAKTKVPEGSPMGNNSAESVLLIAERMLKGEIYLAKEDYGQAISHLQEAVKAEDALRYNEPPDWVMPTRHALGAVMIEAKRFQEAEQVYLEDLKRQPNNGWALYGLSDALGKMQKHGEASKVRHMFHEAWSDADLNILSSCMCTGGKGG